MTYFTNCQTLDELKKVYKHLAQKHHPDVGGDTATMQAINAEYEERFEALKRRQNEQAEADATGCHWCQNKGLWSWHYAEDGCGYHKGRKRSMAEIRAKYGSTTFRRGARTESDALPA